MKKILKIEGMHCSHCQARVEKALNAIPGVTARVDLKKAQATVKLSQEVSDRQLQEAVDEAGYTVTAIEAARGLFG